MVSTHEGEVEEECALDPVIVFFETSTRPRASADLC